MTKGLISGFTRLLLAVAVFAGSCSNPSETTERAEAPDRVVVPETRRSELPPLPLTLESGERLMADTVTGKTILVLFQPECEDCQREAVQIQENLQAFRGYTIYFVSNAALPQQAQFAETYQLSGQPNVYFAQTSINDILNTLGPTPAPSVFIYSAEGRLVKAFKGETPIEQILRFL
jgi:peroxiredoxin